MSILKRLKPDSIELDKDVIQKVRMAVAVDSRWRQVNNQSLNKNFCTDENLRILYQALLDPEKPPITAKMVMNVIRDAESLDYGFDRASDIDVDANIVSSAAICELMDDLHWRLNIDIDDPMSVIDNPKLLQSTHKAMESYVLNNGGELFVSGRSYNPDLKLLWDHLNDKSQKTIPVIMLAEVLKNKTSLAPFELRIIGSGGPLYSLLKIVKPHMHLEPSLDFEEDGPLHPELIPKNPR